MFTLDQIGVEKMPNENSLAQTASIALGTAGAGAVIKWLFDCYQNKALIPPDPTTEAVISGTVLPLLHGAKQIGSALLLAWVQKNAPAAAAVLEEASAGQSPAIASVTPQELRASAQAAQPPLMAAAPVPDLKVAPDLSSISSLNSVIGGK